MARAMIVNPQILLLDEPLSALDQRLRDDFWAMLKDLQQTTNTSIVMVPHDFSEALELGKRASVMNAGRIEQTGSIADIFQRPNSIMVAEFVGMKHLFSTVIAGGFAQLDSLQVELGRDLVNGERYIAIPPENIILSTEVLESSMR